MSDWEPELLCPECGLPTLWSYIVQFSEPSTSVTNMSPLLLPQSGFLL